MPPTRFAKPLSRSDFHQHPKGVSAMTPKDNDPNPDTAKKSDSKTGTPGAQKNHKHRKHGYRGYPNKPEIGGDIHVGTGFAGAGPVGSAGSSGRGIVPEKTRESVEDLEEEDGKK